MKTLFIVGEYRQETNSGAAWVFMGIFEKESDAVKQCTAFNHFVGPCILNKPLPHHMIWPGAYYPLLEESKNG